LNSSIQISVSQPEISRDAAREERDFGLILAVDKMSCKNAELNIHNSHALTP
jgi:hypothetical protein